MVFYAKSKPVQSIQEHTDDLLFVMNKLKNSLDSNPIIDWQLLKIIIVAHDLGKINSLFQDRIRETIEHNNPENKIRQTSKYKTEIDHNILSAAFLSGIINGIGIEEKQRQIIYKSVIFHHKHFLYYVENIDKFSHDKIQEAIYEHIEKVYTREDERIRALSAYVRDRLGMRSAPDFLDLDYNFFSYYNEWFEDEDEDNRQKRTFLILKGMLNLCDYIASSGHKEYAEFYFSGEEIENVDATLLRFLIKNQGRTDIAFKEFQDKTKKSVENNVMTIAFTGSGKTIADHRWTGLRKFYLVPTRISGEAFYFDSIQIYGESKVGLLHGDVNLYIDNPDEDSISITEGTYELSRNLSKPYIISTIDQINTAIFKYPGYERIFSALVNSKITVDEIHLLSPRMYMLLLYLVSFLQENGFDTRFHFMSATIPRIYKEKLEEFDIEFILNEVETDKQNLAAVEFAYMNFDSPKKKDVKIKTLKQWINGHSKVLIIVNSIKHALDMYNSLIKVYDPDRIHLLHSRFKFVDKKEKYRAILDKDADGIWITTQVVEVALHIDFPVVISELSTFESMIQRMGRCNRQGNLEKGFFYFFDDPDYTKINESIYEKEFLKQTREFAKKILKSRSILSQVDRKRIIEEYFNLDKVRKTYQELFEKANKEILRLFGIFTRKTDIQVKGTDLLFSIDPHLSMTESKREAQRLFREGEISQKVVLKSDLEDILKNGTGNRPLEVNKRSIPISKGIYWSLRNKFPGLLTQQRNLLVLDDSDRHIRYSSQKGLEVID